jgi:hypothetical protein
MFLLKQDSKYFDTYSVDVLLEHVCSKQTHNIEIKLKFSKLSSNPLVIFLSFSV